MKPTKKQIKALKLLIDKDVEYLGYGGSAGGGKSYLGCYWLSQMCYYAPGTKYFVGRDSLKDTRESVLNTWRKLAKEINLTGWKYSDNHIIFENGSEIEFLDLSFYPQKDPMYERFGSKEYTAGWIEEAGSVHYMAFEVLKTRIGRWMNTEFKIKKKILCTFNPKKNWVEKTFYRPFANKLETKDTKFIFALPTDNPHLPEDYIQSLRNLKDKATKERLLHGNFDYDDDPSALISYEDIKAIWSNNHVIGGHKYLVCDVARFGSDKARIVVFDEFIIIEHHSFDVSKTTDIQNCINAMRRKHMIQANDCIADEDGVGGGVVDNCNISGFVNNSRPTNKQYEHLKSECGYLLAENIQNFYFHADTTQQEQEDIESELGQLKTFDADKDGKLRILPKVKIKDNIGHSPDWLDIFIMRMYYNLPKITDNYATY